MIISQSCRISWVCDQNVDQVSKNNKIAIFWYDTKKVFLVKYEKYGTLSINLIKLQAV